MSKLGILMMGLAGAALAPAVAYADDVPGRFSYEWNDPRLETGIGVSVAIGGGITGFTSETMREAISSAVGGLWDLRVTIGSHTPVGLDLSYVGNAAGIDALTGTESGTLVGTAFDAAVRFNTLPHNDWNPYVFAGVGWQRYDLTGGSFQLIDTGMQETDNSVAFPLGLGVAYRRQGLVLDLRGTFRASAESNLVLEGIGSDDYAPMHSWQASLAIGYEM